MKKLFHIGLVLSALLLQPIACRYDQPAASDDHRTAASVVLYWHQLLLELERHTPGYRAPVTARTWAYLNVAAWQATLPGMSESVSLETYLEGLPAPPQLVGAFSLPASLNAAFAESIRQFFPTAPPYLLEKIQVLEAEQIHLCRAHTDTATLQRSIAYGKQIARDVWRWSATDALGHEGFLYNFDRNYNPPKCTGCWQPGGAHPMPALLPYWGNIRPFVGTSAKVAIQAPAPYDETPGSAMYAQAVELYTMSQPISNESRWIAEFWSDDVPGLTVSPMGRWISIINQAVVQVDMAFPEILELYLKAAIVNADVVVLCWKNKFHYNLERPEAYIKRVLDPNWVPLHDSPPFPSYPSGHAAMGAATAEVLTAYLGDRFAITDRTHEGRTEFVGKPRSYRSFRDIARESALSRLALGVHYRMDSEEGIRIGQIVGKRMAALPLRVGEAKISSRR